jgi:hypothetical protein
VDDGLDGALRGRANGAGTRQETEWRTRRKKADVDGETMRSAVATLLLLFFATSSAGLRLFNSGV